MTREEAIRSVLDKVLWTRNATEVNKEILTEAIVGALEQEPILDKIKEEIRHLRNFRAEDFDLERYSDCFDERIVFMGDVLEIIDKYKAESEDKE